MAIAAPRRSCSSAICTELRLVVPSSSSDSISALRAERVGRIGGDAGVELDRDLRQRHGGAARVDDLDAVRSCARSTVGEVEVGDLRPRHRRAGRRAARARLGRDGQRRQRLLAGSGCR